MLSGVNRGQNVAEDVSYSGTVAGAMEGTVLGIPSIALSQAYGPGNRDAPPWDTGRRFGPDLIRQILAAGIPRGSLVNVNFPDCNAEAVQGVSVTAQGRRDQDLLRIEPRFDGRSNPYYWIAFSRKGRPNAGRRHRPFRARRQPHFGDAAAARSHRYGLYDETRGSIGRARRASSKSVKRFCVSERVK